MGSGGGVVGAITEPLLGSGDDIADASHGAAMAQRGQALRDFRSFRDAINPATTKSLAQQDMAIASQEKNLSRLEKLTAEIDPAVIEASQQALKLLRGEESKTLAPVRRQRDMQRQKLLNQLREQLGPGAETSSAGIQALTAFDAETDSLMAGTQQAALSQLGSLAGQFRSMGPDMLRESSGLAALSQGRFGTQMEASQGLFNAAAPVRAAAGAQFTGQMVRGQQRQAGMGALMGLAGTIGGAMLGGPAGAAVGGQLGSAVGAGGPGFDPSKFSGMA